MPSKQGIIDLKSFCCNEIHVASVGSEGTGCYVCSKCRKPMQEHPLWFKSVDACKMEIAKRYKCINWSYLIEVICTADGETNDKLMGQYIDEAIVLYGSQFQRQVDELKAELTQIKSQTFPASTSNDFPVPQKCTCKWQAYSTGQMLCNGNCKW